MWYDRCSNKMAAIYESFMIIMSITDEGESYEKNNKNLPGHGSESFCVC